MSKKTQKLKKMTLDSFLQDEQFGKVTNWAAETDQFLPTIPLSQRVPEHNTLHMVPIENLNEIDIQNAFQGVKTVKFIQHFAYVQFSNSQDCISALEKDGINIKGTSLKISPAKEGIHDRADDRNWGRNGWQSQTQRRPMQSADQSWDRSNWGQTPPRNEQERGSSNGNLGSGPRSRPDYQQQRDNGAAPSWNPRNGQTQSNWNQAARPDQQYTRSARQPSFDGNSDARPQKSVSKADTENTWRK
eukprot:NODE_705_length_4989_cov_0.075460.p2 type:complete len:245 gc:universal NODE_705_length_4989_cov_0.075460:3394-2660(-)